MYISRFLSLDSGSKFIQYSISSGAVSISTNGVNRSGDKYSTVMDFKVLTHFSSLGVNALTHEHEKTVNIERSKIFGIVYILWKKLR
jgi:hypothetical protein